MKPRHTRFLPQTLVVCVAPLIACASASAEVIQFNEQLAVAAASPIPWTLPSGTNLLTTATVDPANASTHEGSSAAWTTLVNGGLGTPSQNGESVTPNNNEVVTFALDLTSKPAGYDITSFDSYCSWGDSGRDNQQYTLEYSVVGDPATFIPLGSFQNNSGNPNNCTHINLTDTSGYLAQGVHSVRITFGGGQENGYTGFREFVLRTTEAPAPIITSLNEANNTNVWTLPGGLNLLNGATAHTPSAPAGTNHGNNEITSSSWATLTDGSVGTYTNIGTSVGPLNNTSVIFPLDTSINTKGYDITSFDSFGAWVNSGRDNQDFSILYSTWDAPDVFIPLAHIVNHTANTNSPNDSNSTHSRITPLSGYLATGVAAIQFHFDTQENGWVGYREFKALGTAASVTAPLTWLGSNGTWISGADTNWKQTVGGAPATYSSTGSLTFDNSATNKTINVPSPLTAFSMAFDNTVPYILGGSAITVTNGLTVSNSGNVTFNGPLQFGADVSYSGSGNLGFNGSIQAGSLTVKGSGTVTLAQSNTLTGITSVNSGTLTASNNGSLGTSALSMTGGTVNLTSAAPTVSSISGPTGSIVLGNTAGATNTTLTVGDATSVSSFSGSISNAAGRVGSLTKVGNSALTFSGANTYTGPTTVNGGSLDLNKYESLYNGTLASWTAANIQVGNGGTLGFLVPSQFFESDINSALSIGGFAPGSSLGLNTEFDFNLTRDLNRPGMGLRKTGPATLTVSGNNASATGATRIYNGVLVAASPTTSMGGDVLMGNGSAPVYLNMGGPNQFGPNSVLSVDNSTFYLMRMNLRGFDQAIAGLNSPVDSGINIVQNDETNQPGYTVDPGPVTLTINAATNHSFRGIVRNGNGGALTVIKNGPGTQEFIHHPVQGFGYTGPTALNQGTLRLRTVNGNAGFSSDITIANGATLAFNATGGDYNFNPQIHGSGQITATGTDAIRLSNSSSSFSGGLTIGSPGIGTYDGFLALVSQGPQGAGNGPGQTCVGGAMTPTNVITVQGGATLALDGIAPLGESSLLPAYAQSVVVNNSGLRGAGLAFVANLTLNHAEVTVGSGLAIAGFDSSLCLVGTVLVGGDSNLATTIITPTPGPTANISLGSAGLPGTTFNVTDVTGSAAVDLNVDAVLRNVNSAVSPLTKTGAGTMWIRKTNTYTGDTTVAQGELRMDVACLADSANVTIATGATLNLLHGSSDTIHQLTLGGSPVSPGTYGAVGNTLASVQTPFIKGDGILNVTSAGSSEVTYAQWAAQITTGDSSRTGDPDSDGLTNLQEFLYGTSPTAPTASLSTSEKNGANLIIRWNQRATGTSVYQLEESTTLVNPWSPSSVVPTDNATQDIPNYVRKEAVIPINNARKFVRVQATE